jgi:magnesium and cobalt transporter
VPESKRLNVLLREFRANRNHIAIVVDEYGGVSGLVTIEDVLEQIVGDIEDEYDFDESEDNVIAEGNGRWRVKAQTEIEDFNARFGTAFADDEFDTVGGLVVSAFGRLPKRGESTRIDGITFRVVRADSRRVHTLQVERVERAAGEAAQS